MREQLADKGNGNYAYIGAGRTVTALYEVVPARGPTASEVAPLHDQAPREETAAADSGELLTVKLRYRHLGVGG